MFTRIEFFRLTAVIVLAAMSTPLAAEPEGKTAPAVQARITAELGKIEAELEREQRAELEKLQTKLRAEFETKLDTELAQLRDDLHSMVAKEFAFLTLSSDLPDLMQNRRISKDEIEDIARRFETIADDPELSARPQFRKLLDQAIQVVLKSGFEQVPAAVGADLLAREVAYASSSKAVEFAAKRRSMPHDEIKTLASRVATLAQDPALRSRSGFPKLVDRVVRMAMESDSDDLLAAVEKKLQQAIPLSVPAIMRLARHYGENLIKGRYPLILQQQNAIEAFHRYLNLAHAEAADFAELLPLDLMISARLPPERQEAEIQAIRQQIHDLDPEQQAGVVLQTVRYIDPLLDRSKNASDDLLAIAGGRMVDANRRLLANLVADPLVNTQLNQLAWREADAGNQRLAKNLYQFIRTLSQSISGHESLAFQSKVRKFVQTHLDPWIKNAIVVYGIKLQNQKTRSYSKEQIAELDRRWRGETASGRFRLIQEVLDNPLSRYLQRIKAESDGLYREIFVMDAVGLDVAASNPTSDYWQGDEAKWRKTYLAGADGLYVSEMEFDESTLSWQIQISLTITDPQTAEPIGAITVGIEPGAIID